MDTTKLRNHGIRLATGLVLLASAVGCSNTVTAPTGDGAAAPAGEATADLGLSGAMTEKRSTIMGNVGSGDVTVNLFGAVETTCNTQSTPLQATTSQTDGSYAFPAPVSEGNYCIEYGGETYNCPCDWAGEQCECSPPPQP